MTLLIDLQTLVMGTQSCLICTLTLVIDLQTLVIRTLTLVNINLQTLVIGLFAQFMGVQTHNKNSRFAE